MLNLLKRPMDEMQQKIEFHSITRAYIAGIIMLGIFQIANFSNGSSDYRPLFVIAGMSIVRFFTRVRINSKLGTSNEE